VRARSVGRPTVRVTGRRDAMALPIANVCIRPIAGRDSGIWDAEVKRMKNKGDRKIVRKNPTAAVIEFDSRRDRPSDSGEYEFFVK